jgi:hypothetical protein
MAKKKTAEISKDTIVSHYTDYVLTYGKKPHSVYDFTKSISLEETQFYKYFASFEALEEQFFPDMLHYTLELLSTTSEYEQYDAVQKLSCFYFTFFEIATANRSFVMYLLNQERMPLKNLLKLKILRKDFLSYVKTVLDTPFKVDNQRITDIQNRVVHEGAWLQFLSILNYWTEDNSPSFEKTDVFIEKSIKASFDMVYNVPIESILDFGKFIWKEKFGNFNSRK